MLFDRICKEHGIRHLLTAPYSPTTTGKVERFHKTLKREFLDGQVFVSIEAAQAAISAWVAQYNTEREHQSLGNRPPAERFALARREDPEPEPEPKATQRQEVIPRLVRRVRSNGKVSLLNFNYHVGRYLAGQSVELVLRDGLIEVFSEGTLVATHARRHRPDQDDDVFRHAIATPAKRPGADPVVMRKVDRNGSVSFAGTDYRAGNAYKGRQVEVSVAGDAVHIWADGKLLRTHPARHDKRKEHGAFANPGGRPDRSNAA